MLLFTRHSELASKMNWPLKIHPTAVTRGHFDAWSTDQEFPIVILIWQTRFTEIAVSRKL